MVPCLFLAEKNIIFICIYSPILTIVFKFLLVFPTGSFSPQNYCCCMFVLRDICRCSNSLPSRLFCRPSSSCEDLVNRFWLACKICFSQPPPLVSLPLVPHLLSWLLITSWCPDGPTVYCKKHTALERTPTSKQTFSKKGEYILYSIEDHQLSQRFGSFGS